VSAPRFSGVILSIIESGFRRPRMGEVKPRRLKELRLEALDFRSPALRT